MNDEAIEKLCKRIDGLARAIACGVAGAEDVAKALGAVDGKEVGDLSRVVSSNCKALSESLDGVNKSLEEIIHLMEQQDKK